MATEMGAGIASWDPSLLLSCLFKLTMLPDANKYKRSCLYQSRALLSPCVRQRLPPLPAMADLELLTMQHPPNLQNSNSAKTAPGKQHSQGLPCCSLGCSKTPVKSTKVQRILKKRKFGRFEHWPPVKGHNFSVVCKGSRENMHFSFKYKLLTLRCRWGEHIFIQLL